MKLTAEQWFEISMALQHGVSKASWEGFGSKPWSALNEAERASILATVREHETAVARSIPPDPAVQRFNQRYLDSISLAATTAGDAEEQQQRDAFYAQPAAARAQALRTWKAMVNELLSQAHFFSSRQRRSVDHRLAAHALPPLDTLTRRLDRKVARLLRRGVIKNDEEYYLVQEVLSDVEFDISDQDRERLDHMAATYRAPEPPGSSD